MSTGMLIMALLGGGPTAAEAYTAMAEKGIIIVIAEDDEPPVDTTEPPVLRGYWPSVLGDYWATDTLQKEESNDPR